MNQLTVHQPKPMLIDYMADKYALRPEEFSKTVRATCGLSAATAEQFAAFLIVAKQYNLNPITKEIYAFPGKGGGVVPIVSIDGWVNLVNSHGQCDGFEFEMEHGLNGELISCTCRMYRKDRKHPVTVTEYFVECVRSTEPWKMAHRMLRHKALIQAARYAFGFAGVYDEDEARTIADNEPRNITPVQRVPSPSDVEQIEDHGSDKYRPGDEVQVQGTVPSAPKDDPISSGPITAGPKREGPSMEGKGYDDRFTWALDKIRHFDDGGALESWWNAQILPDENEWMPPDLTELANAYGARIEELNGEGS